VYTWGEGTTLKVGKFCSIAQSVTTLLGGEHHVDWVTEWSLQPEALLLRTFLRMPLLAVIRQSLSDIDFHKQSLTTYNALLGGIGRYKR
jgi:hypothetical protein